MLIVPTSQHCYFITSMAFWMISARMIIAVMVFFSVWQRYRSRNLLLSCLAEHFSPAAENKVLTILTTWSRHGGDYSWRLRTGIVTSLIHVRDWPCSIVIHVENVLGTSWPHGWRGRRELDMVTNKLMYLPYRIHTYLYYEDALCMHRFTRCGRACIHG